MGGCVRRSSGEFLKKLIVAATAPDSLCWDGVEWDYETPCSEWLTESTEAFCTALVHLEIDQKQVRDIMKG